MPPRVRGPRMRKHWHGTQGAAQIGLTVTQGVVISVSVGAGEDPVTLLRSRGEILVVGSPDAVTDSDVVGLGSLVSSPTNAIPS